MVQPSMGSRIGSPFASQAGSRPSAPGTHLGPSVGHVNGHGCIQAKYDWDTHIGSLTLMKKMDAKVNWQSKRKAYINAIRKKKPKLDEELAWDGFIDSVSITAGQATAAVGIDYQNQIIYLAAQDGASMKEREIIIDEAYKLGAVHNPHQAGGWRIREVGGASPGLHAEMQIVSHFLAQGTLPPAGMHYAAAGKPCCRCCAAMVTALNGTCKSVGPSPYEYMWCDPFALYDAMMGQHPIIKDTGLINAYGWDAPIMRN